MDGAILVTISTADSPMPETREHILLARQVGGDTRHRRLRRTRWTRWPIRKLADLVEMEIRDLLTKCSSPATKTPIIAGSALVALEDKDPEMGEEVDPQADGAGVGAFVRSRTVEGQAVRCRSRRVLDFRPCTVRHGPCRRGVIKVNEESKVSACVPTAKTVVTGVKCSASCWIRAKPATTSARCSAAQSARKSRRSQVLASPGTITPHLGFRARVLHPHQGRRGSLTPFSPTIARSSAPHDGRDRRSSSCRRHGNSDARRISMSKLIIPIAMDEGLNASPFAKAGAPSAPAWWKIMEVKIRARVRAEGSLSSGRHPGESRDRMVLWSKEWTRKRYAYASRRLITGCSISRERDHQHGQAHGRAPGAQTHSLPRWREQFTIPASWPHVDKVARSV